MKPSFDKKKEDRLLLAVRLEIFELSLKLEDLHDDVEMIKFASRATRYTHPGEFASRHRNVEEMVNFQNYKNPMNGFLRSNTVSGKKLL